MGQKGGISAVHACTTYMYYRKCPPTPAPPGHVQLSFMCWRTLTLFLSQHMQFTIVLSSISSWSSLIACIIDACTTSSLLSHSSPSSWYKILLFIVDKIMKIVSSISQIPHISTVMWKPSLIHVVTGNFRLRYLHDLWHWHFFCANDGLLHVQNIYCIASSLSWRTKFTNRLKLFSTRTWLVNFLCISSLLGVPGASGEFWTLVFWASADHLQ